MDITTPVKLVLKPDEDLPTNVETIEQLVSLPPECLNDDENAAARPLRHVDDKGNVSTYVLRPMSIIIMLVLVVETIERFSFYGVYYTQTLYLTGVYNEDWNAGFTSVQAASYVSLSTMVAYTTPFIGALLSDTYLGDYNSIVFGALFLYLPGLLLVALTSVPHLLGEEFNTTVYSIAVLFLWPMGTGIVKSVVNVFGAKQLHPLLQSSFIESYYVNFYTSINIGALAGIIVLPILAQTHVTAAYLLPVAMLGFGVLLFIMGTPHYVISQPVEGGFLCSTKKRRTSTSSDNTVPLTSILHISLLIVPFCIAYSQMPTTFILQGTIMKKAFHVVDAATMNSLDALSVLIFGYLTGSHIYPALARRGMRIPTTYKFAMGSCLAVLSILWALVVEGMIRRAYELNGSQISVLWQAPSYILIGFGEIWAVSAAYEAAFTASSPETKALASAINIFCVGGIPNLFCILLYQVCQGWFRNSRGDTNIQHVEDYVTAHVSKYFWVLVGILLFGVLLNTLPVVRDFVESVEETAFDLVKTPISARRGADEETPLLRKKIGAGPVLKKMGSMRAGPSLSHTKTAQKHVKYSFIHRFYKGVATTGDKNAERRQKERHLIT